MKPRLFDPFFRKDHEKHDQISQADHWRAFMVALAVAIVLIVQCVGIHYYVDWYVNIPQEWK